MYDRTFGGELIVRFLLSPIWHSLGSEIVVARSQLHQHKAFPDPVERFEGNNSRMVF